jgi:hypothetical protein
MSALAAGAPDRHGHVRDAMSIHGQQGDTDAVLGAIVLLDALNGHASLALVHHNGLVVEQALAVANVRLHSAHGIGAAPRINAGRPEVPADIHTAPCQPKPDLDADRLFLPQKARAYLVACCLVFGAVTIAEHRAFSNHAFSKSLHSGRDRFPRLEKARHHSQISENLDGISIGFHPQYATPRMVGVAASRVSLVSLVGF